MSDGIPIFDHTDDTDEKGTKDARIRAANALGNVIGGSLPPGVGFALLLFDFGQGGATTWISNAKREDMVEVLREMIGKLSPILEPEPAPQIAWRRFSDERPEPMTEILAADETGAVQASALFVHQPPLISTASSGVVRAKYWQPIDKPK